MTDGPDKLRGQARSNSDKSVETLANQALTFLAKHRLAGQAALSEKYIRFLRAAVLDRDSARRGEIVAQMRSDGISLETLIDVYIPAVARRLGDEWCADGVSFADVTIGVARLQGLVREFGAELDPGGPRDIGVAVVVLADDYHTLGAMILTTQLRRLGISVRLLVGAGLDEAGIELRTGLYDAVLISASHSDSLAKLAKFVKNLRQITDRNVPIVIGGPIVERSTDVCAATGADAATSDLEEALRACRLKISRDVAEKPRTVR